MFCFEEYYREALKVVREENQKLFDRHMQLLSEAALKVFFLLFKKPADCIVVGINALCIIILTHIKTLNFSNKLRVK